MEFHKPLVKKSSQLYKRAVISVAIFIIVLILFIMVSHNSQQPPLKGAALLTSLIHSEGFIDQQKDKIKARNAGFWQYASDTNTSEAGYAYTTDRLELKSNGIFWQVTETYLGLPSKKTAHFMHIRTGYMNPFIAVGASDDSISCEVHIFRQAYVTDNDSCYGPSNFDTTWIVHANGHYFEQGGRTYAPFDTAGGALHRFFPDGALKIVDKPALQQCPEPSGYLPWARSVISADMRTIQVPLLSADAVDKIINAYYRQFVFSIAQPYSLAVTGKKCMVGVSFDVSVQGSVVNLRVVKIAEGDKKLKEAILKEISAWVFPRQQAGSPIAVQREFWF